MRFLEFLKPYDINRGLEEYDMTPDAVLLDVRTPQEYSEGHIPCSENVPLQEIERVENVIERKDTPLFVYCRSGSRSRLAQDALRRMGYTNVKNIGGIGAYRGHMERGNGKGMLEVCFAGGD